MKQRLIYLVKLFAVFVLAFAFTKPIFLLCNEPEGARYTFFEIVQTVWHGLPMDAATAAYLVSLPFLLLWLSLWLPKIPYKPILATWLSVCSLIVVLVAVADISLYAFWQVKLDATIFFYLDSPGEAAASVSVGYIAVRVLAVLVLSAALSYLFFRLTPRSFPPVAKRRNLVIGNVAALLLGGILFLTIRGGVGKSTMNTGNAYWCNDLYLNQSAVNPTFSIFSSMGKQEDFAGKFNFLPEAQRSRVFNNLYAAERTDSVSLQLLNTQRPNILIIEMEGYGGRFIEALGGVPGVSPNYNRLIREGVFFSNFYANSFRTDRGTVCIYSGHISYPTTSIMKLPTKLTHLPSLPRTLRRAGYSADFLYGGDVNFTNTKGYLLAMGYQHITSDVDFTEAQRHSNAWGVNDDITFDYLYNQIVRRPVAPNSEATNAQNGDISSASASRTIRQAAATAQPSPAPWHIAFLTLSSHEPFVVPYHRLKDPKLNAFAYTDHCLGQFIERLRRTPQWKNLLVICLPDHGFRYKITTDDPVFYHVPMLWLGGAVKEPRVVNTIMNQSDMAATLLAQLGLPHSDFHYSRNVLSPGYRYPFAYSTSATNFLFVDSTGTTLFDLDAKRPLHELPRPNADRLLRGKAILQSTYDELGRW
jgi:phosphoglycerol transferase MdoB-like AlkP superfamily enzyme